MILLLVSEQQAIAVCVTQNSIIFKPNVLNIIELVREFREGKWMHTDTDKMVTSKADFSFLFLVGNRARI